MVQELSSCLGSSTKRFADDQGSFLLYDEPCAIRLKGDLEALIRDFPFGTIAAEIVAAISCKGEPSTPCDPLYVKSDELLVSEEALVLWKGFRQLLGKAKLLYLPSQLSELVRYDSDFDSFGDQHFDYGDETVEAAIDIPLSEREACFEATLFNLTDEVETSPMRFRQSFISQRRRSQPTPGILLGIPGFVGREVYTNGALA